MPSRWGGLLSKAATNLGMADRDISTLEAQLHKDWFTKVNGLKDMGIEFLARYVP